MSFLAVAACLAVLLEREPLSVGEIRALGSCDDVGAGELLDRALARRVLVREAFGDGIVPSELDREIEEALVALERVDEARALFWARRLAEELTADSGPRWAARHVLARSGDSAVVREALARYFEAPAEWKTVLNDAARAEDDPRLADFLSAETANAPPTELLASTLERNLVRTASRRTRTRLLSFEGVSERTLARVLAHLAVEPAPDMKVGARLSALAAGATDAEARLYAVFGLGRRRALDHAPALRRLATSDDERLQAVACHALLRLGDHEMAATLEERIGSASEPLRTELVALVVAREGAVAARRLAERTWSASARSGLLLVNAAPEVAAAVLERVGTEDRSLLLRVLAERDDPVVANLASRADVAALYPYLARSTYAASRRLVLETGAPAGGPALAALLLSQTASLDEKENAVRVLGAYWREAVAAGGAAAFSEMERATTRARSLASWRDAAGVSEAPVPALARPDGAALSLLAVDENPRPDLLPQFFAWHERDPKAVVPLLSSSERGVYRRAVATLALRADRAGALQLLADVATGGNPLGRTLALRGLAEVALDRVGMRLHRLAGDPDRVVRFEAALALVPGGEPWAVRLLVANLDPSSPFERRRASRALRRAPGDGVKAILEAMIEEGTAANVFAVNALLDRIEANGTTLGPAARAKAWELVRSRLASDPEALRAASRLSEPAAIRAVLRRLDRFPRS